MIAAMTNNTARHFAKQQYFAWLTRAKAAGSHKNQTITTHLFVTNHVVWVSVINNECGTIYNCEMTGSGMVKRAIKV